MHVFVTVGSTFFNELVDAVISRPVLHALSNKGYTHLVIQCGKYPFAPKIGTSEPDEPRMWMQEDVQVVAWRYRPTLKDEYEAADLIISHAGSGTVLDVLRLGKPLIVVPNPSLLDNHQVDLASELDKLGHLKASTTERLASDIEAFDANILVPFPPRDPSKFSNILDEEMGFL